MSANRVSGRGGAPAAASCREVLDLLHLHVEGETDVFRAAIVEDHLLSCAACRAARTAMEEERLLVIEAAMDAPQMSERFREKLVDRIREDRRAGRTEWRVRLFFPASGAAVAALVLVVASLRYGGAPWRGPPEAREVVGGPLPPATAALVELERATLPRVEQGPSPGAPGSPSAPSPNGPLAVHFRDILFMATNLSSPPGVGSVDDPCRPDPNSDGKADLNDVAYACQFLLGRAPPQPVAEAEMVTPDPDCEDICLRA